MRYDGLKAHLAKRTGESWQASFAEIERVLGFELPQSARKHSAWWANQSGGGHSQAAAWRRAGWRTRNVDLKAMTVQFQRESASDRVQPSLPDDAKLFSIAAGYVGQVDRELLIREAMHALIEREAGRRLARLGGAAPEFEPAPRERDGA